MTKPLHFLIFCASLYSLVSGCGGSDSPNANGTSDPGAENIDPTSRPGIRDIADRPQQQLVNCETIRAVIRDFRGWDELDANGSRIGHPDFERFGAATNVPTIGLVAPQLGPDNKPVYADNDNVPKPNGPQTTNAANFNQWYRDVPGVNMRFEIQLPLVSTAPTDGVATIVYDNPNYFPLTGQGFGDRLVDGQLNNFHFTTEIATSFSYDPSKNLVFTFTGDDDLWIFVNGRLALDRGGHCNSVYGPCTGSIDFNAQAAALGLQPNQTYEMRIFHAERHTNKSQFRIETNIQCFANGLI